MIIAPGADHGGFHVKQAVTVRVEDDDMNLLCLGAGVIGPELAYKVIRAFITAKFSNAPRHRRRLKKVLAIENAYRIK